MKDTLPDLWKETLSIYVAVKQMIKDGYEEGTIIEPLASNIIYTLKRKRKLDIRAYELILNKKAARPLVASVRTANLPPAAAPSVPKAATDRIATIAERAKLVAALHAHFKKKAEDEGRNAHAEEEHLELAVEGEIGI